VSLVFEPLSNAKLILSGTEEAWLIAGMFTALVDGWSAHIPLKAIEWPSRRKAQAGL
jgi:hypothetical protein